MKDICYLIKKLKNNKFLKKFLNYLSFSILLLNFCELVNFQIFTLLKGIWLIDMLILVGYYMLFSITEYNYLHPLNLLSICLTRILFVWLSQTVIHLTHKFGIYSIINSDLCYSYDILGYLIIQARHFY